MLLVLAALGTSWSSYQATRWNGEQAAAAGRTNAIRIEASRAQGLAEAQSQVDVATFIAWADADQRGEQDLAAVLRRPVPRRVPDRVRRLAAPPTRSPTPRHRPRPFAMEEYQLEPRDQAAELDAQAEASAAEVRLDIQRSSNYVLTVVLYAIVLFFAGMSTRVSTPTAALGTHHRRLPRVHRSHRLDRHLPSQPRDLTPDFGRPLHSECMRHPASTRTTLGLSDERETTMGCETGARSATTNVRPSGSAALPSASRCARRWSPWARPIPAALRQTSTCPWRT